MQSDQTGFLEEIDLTNPLHSSAPENASKIKWNRKWVEIISIRLSQRKNVPMVRKIYRSIMTSITGAEATMDAVLYTNARVETDWSIHIFWEYHKVPAEKTTLGLRLAETLRSFGLVNHSVWKNSCNNKTERKKS